MSASDGDRGRDRGSQHGALESIEIACGDTVVAVRALAPACVEWTQAVRADTTACRLVTQRAPALAVPEGRRLRGPRVERRFVVESRAGGQDSVEVAALVLERGIVNLRAVRRELVAREAGGRNVRWALEIQ